MVCLKISKNIKQKEILETNKAAWEKVANLFAAGLYLPSWGPFQELRNRNMLGKINGKTFMEIGFGSGHSVKYLVHNGAKKVFGLDISNQQFKLATSINQKAIQKKLVVLKQGPMEELWDLQEKADIVFSIYGLGWTVNLKKTLNNIKKYLKPEGQLIFSWEHPYYSRFTFKNHNLVLTNPYFSEKQRYLANWNGSEGAYIKDRKISSWINYLTNAGFVLENLYEPRPITFPKRSKDPQRYYSKFKSQLTPTSIVFCCKLKP